MNFFRRSPRHWLLTTLCIAFVAGFALTGCEDPGPAEEAGQEIDEAVEDARDAMDEMGDDIEDELEDRRDNG